MRQTIRFNRVDNGADAELREHLRRCSASCPGTASDQYDRSSWPGAPTPRACARDSAQLILLLHDCDNSRGVKQYRSACRNLQAGPAAPVSAASRTPCRRTASVPSGVRAAPPTRRRGGRSRCPSLRAGPGEAAGQPTRETHRQQPAYVWLIDLKLIAVHLRHQSDPGSIGTHVPPVGGMIRLDRTDPRATDGRPQMSSYLFGHNTQSNF